MRLLEPTDGGDRRSTARDVLALKGAELKAFRREVQIIFQDPYASLNPRITIGEIVAEPLVIHGIGTQAERRRSAPRSCSTSSA